MTDREPPDRVQVRPEEVRALVEGERSFWILALLIQAACVFTNVVYVIVGAIHRFLIQAEPIGAGDAKTVLILTGALSAVSALGVLGALLIRPLLWREVAKAAGRPATDMTVANLYTRVVSSSNPLGRSMLLFLKCSLIVLALAEVPGVCGLVFFLLEGSFVALIGGCAFALLAKLALLGTRERFIALMEERLEPHGDAR